MEVFLKSLSLMIRSEGFSPLRVFSRLRIMDCFRKPSRCSAAVSSSSERPKPRRAYFRVAASSAISRSAVCFGMAFMLERLVMWR